MDGIDAMIAESQTAFEERMLGQLDDRMTAIARLIRSDNQALAGRIGQLGGEPRGRRADGPRGDAARSCAR